MSKECSVEGCKNPAHCKGYCNMHYQRLHKTGSLELLGRPEVPEGFVTTTQAANSLAVSRGAVGQAIKRGTLIAKKKDGRYLISEEALESFSASQKRPVNAKQCKWEGCEEKSRSLGLCLTHYPRAMYNADNEHLIPEEHRKPRCFVRDCQSPQYAKGLCRKHDAQERHGHTDPMAPDLLAESADPTTFGGRVKILRIRQGMTMRELGNKSGVSHQRIQQIEHSTASNPHPKTVHYLAQSLHVDVAELLGLQRQKDVRPLEPPTNGANGANGASEVNGFTDPQKEVSLDKTPDSVVECPFCQGAGKLRIAPEFEATTATLT